MAQKLMCEVCGNTFSTMDEADKHEYEATMMDPESRDHWVQFQHVGEVN